MRENALSGAESENEIGKKHFWYNERKANPK